MSQAKVDKYKQEKYNRKNAKKKTNFKKIIAYIVTLIIALAFIVWIGYSIAINTGIYTPPTTTAHTELSDEELESLRNQLIQSGDSNVQTESETTTDATTAAETTVAETTK